MGTMKIICLPFCFMNSRFSRRLPLLLLGTLFLFSGCFNFGSGSSTTTATNDARFNLYENSDYSLSVPKNWDTIDKTQFTAEVPEETDVVFRNNVKNETYTADIAIIRRPFQTSLPSLEFAKYVYNRQSSGLYDFKELRKDLVKIKVAGKEEDTFLLIFEARKSPKDKLLRFYQTFGFKNNVGFIAIGSLSPQEDANTAKLIEDSIKSLVVK